MMCRDSTLATPQDIPSVESSVHGETLVYFMNAMQQLPVPNQANRGAAVDQENVSREVVHVLEDLEAAL